MKVKLLFFVLCFIFQVKGQNKVFLPIDSLGYFKLIDLKGNSRTNWTEFEDLKYVANNQNFLAKKNGKWGIVDSTLTFLLDPKFDTIQFDERYIFAESPGSLNILSRKLENIKRIPDFIRKEKIQKKDTEWDPNSTFRIKYIVHTIDQTIIYDEQFEQISDFTFDDAFPMNKVILTRKGSKFGFLSTKNSTIEPKYSSIGFHNDWIIEVSDLNKRRHYYLEDGTELPDTDSTLQCDEVNEQFKIYKNGKGFLYDLEMKSIIEYTGDDVFPISYSNNYNKYDNSTIIHYFAFKSKDKIGVLLDNGSVLIQPAFDHIIYGHDERFIVRIDERFGVVDAQAKWIIEPLYTYIENTITSNFKVYDSIHIGVCNKDGQLIVPLEYEELSCDFKGIITKKNGYYGFADLDGKIILKNEWDKIYELTHSITEFTKNYKNCAVNFKGLLTPINCFKIHANEETIKYYLSDKIVIGHIENDSLIDIEVYERYPSITINDYNLKIHILIAEPTIDLFQSQLNGKFGSIRKHGEGFEVEPIYDNISSEYVTNIGSRPYLENFDIGGTTFQTKEKLWYFDRHDQDHHTDYLAYLGTRFQGGMHINSLDGVIKPEQQFEYASSDKYKRNGYSLLLAREGYTSRAITEGEINFNTGQDVILLRDYFIQLNSYNNLMINSTKFFSLLSSSPMIKVSNPSWEAKEIRNNNFDIRLLGPFKYYEELKSGLAIFSREGTKFGIYFIENKIIAEEEFDKIIPFVDNTIQYFYMIKKVREQDGFYSDKWMLYDFKGQKIKDSFSAMEYISSGHYIVTKKDRKFVMTENGDVIYVFL